MQLGYYLRDIARFLDTHPQEIVILHFQCLSHLPRNDKRRLLTTLFQFFAAKMIRVSDMKTLTLQYMWQKRKQIVAVFARRDVIDFEKHIFGSLAWPDDVIFQPRVSTECQSADELTNWLLSAQCQQQQHVVAERRLNITSAVLSPDMSMLFGEFRHRSMRDLVSAEVCPALTEWLNKQPCLNVLLIDFIGLGGVAGQIIGQNMSLQSE